MRLILDTLRECPILFRAADKAGIHGKTLEYWMKYNAAGHDDYDNEWKGLPWRFHEHCESAIAEAHDRLVGAACDIAMGVRDSLSPPPEVTSVIYANNYSMEFRADPIESAKSHFFDTSSWGPFCDVTLTLKQARQSDRGEWIKIDDYPCRQAFRHFMNLLNKAVYGAAFCRHGKRLRVLPVLEKGDVHARALRSCELGTSGRWHIHCAIELPSHFDAVALEKLIRHCWAKIEWGYGRILVRDGANAGWINYMLKDRQKSEFDGFLDCIIIESLHNPIADA